MLPQDKTYNHCLHRIEQIIVSLRYWFWRKQSPLVRQLQPYWVRAGFNKFLLCQGITDEMLLIQLTVTDFYSVLIKDLMEFFCLFVGSAFLSRYRMCEQYSFWYLQNRSDYTILLCTFVVYCHYYHYYLCWGIPVGISL